MENLIIIFVTLLFGLIFFNVINNKKFSLFSFILLFLIGLIFFLKVKYYEIYVKIFFKINNVNLFITIFSGFALLVSIIEYIIGFKSIKKNNIIEEKSDEKKEIDKSKDVDNLMVYIEMMDEPIACLTNNAFLINNKMKKILKYDNYVIDKKKFNSYIHSADKNSFYNNEGKNNFRLNVNGEYEWFEAFFSIINKENYCLIRKCDYKKINKVNFKTFKELISTLSYYESENNDYYLVFFDIINYSDLISFYGKDFTNLVIDKYLDNIIQLPYISDNNLYYISKNEYVLLIDNLTEYNILLSELENNSSIITKNDIIISDNKICMRGKVGAIASSNVKNKNSSNVVNKGFEMVKLASSKDYSLDYAIYHEIDEEIDYSLKDLEIDLDFDFTKYKKRIQ